MYYTVFVSENATPKNVMASAHDKWENVFDGKCHKYDACIMFRRLADKHPRVRMFKGKRMGRLVMEK